MPHRSLRAAVALAAASAVVFASAAAVTAGVRPATAAAEFQLPTAALDLAPIDADGNHKVLVRYAGGVIPAGALDALTDAGVVRGIELPTIATVAVTAPLAVVQAIALDPRVASVTPQGRIQFDLYASVGQINARGIEDTEDYQTAAGATLERPGVTGAGVTVAIIDTGIAVAHPDVGPRVKAGLNFEFSEIQDEGGISFEQWDAYAEATGPSALEDEVGHGTHVAGTVGGDGTLASLQGSELDLRGVAPGVEFVAMRIGSPASGIVEDLDFEEAALAALDYTRRHAAELGIRLASNSWGILPAEPNTVPGVGEPSDYEGMAEMVRSVWEAGITTVWSAGNDGPGFDTIRPAPGGLPWGITVAAACKIVDGACPDGEITGFSSRGLEDGTGNQVDVSAPGDQIMAALSPSVLAPLTECAAAQVPGYFCISGTSMAAPHVSGVVALLYEVHPEITPDEAKACVNGTADDLLERGWDVTSGWGLVNAREAVQCAHELTLAAGTPAPAPSPVDPAPAPAPAAPAAPSVPTPVTGGGFAALGLATLALAGRLGARR